MSKESGLFINIRASSDEIDHFEYYDKTNFDK